MVGLLSTSSLKFALIQCLFRQHEALSFVVYRNLSSLCKNLD